MYKICSFIFIILITSCTRPSSDAKAILRFVDQGNDGWNALSISFYDDSICKAEWAYEKYSIVGDTLFWDDNRLILIKTKQGCIARALYIPANKRQDTILMRIISDSIYCKRKTDSDLYGAWIYNNNPGKADTMILNLQGGWHNQTKIDWDVTDNNQLHLKFKGLLKEYSIENLSNDTLWLVQYPEETKIGNITQLKAIRIAKRS